MSHWLFPLCPTLLPGGVNPQELVILCAPAKYCDPQPRADPPEKRHMYWLLGVKAPRSQCTQQLEKRCQRIWMKLWQHAAGILWLHREKKSKIFENKTSKPFTVYNKYRTIVYEWYIPHGHNNKGLTVLLTPCYNVHRKAQRKRWACCFLWRRKN